MKNHDQITTPLIYEDDDWFVVAKPTALASHAPRPGANGVVEWLALHLDRRLQLCSRLDKGTSGVLLLARHGRASRTAQQIHEQGRAVKSYLFLSDGPGNGREKWRLETPLDGKACSTEFQILERRHGLTCCQAVIRRGRTHQIRRHAAASGLAILGDEQYGGTPFIRLCLHCQQVEWPGISHPLRWPRPDSFGLLLAGCDRDDLTLAMAVAWERRLAWPTLVSDSLCLARRGELPLPVSIFSYGGVLLTTIFDEDLTAARTQTLLAPCFDYLAAKLPIHGGVTRCHVPNPHQRRLVHDQVEWGNLTAAPNQCREHGLRFGLDLHAAQHSGLFLDQRDSRRLISQQAHGLRVANLFAFTCSFSLMAAAAGAEVVFSIDLAASALARGKENFAVNGLDKSGRGKFIQEDARKWLARQERKKERDPAGFQFWDLIICDPPVYAAAGRGKKGFQVEKAWPELARQIRALLSPNGRALFANNHRAGHNRFYQTELEKHFRQVTPLQPPLDFPTLPSQPDQLRIYWCEV